MLGKKENSSVWCFFQYHQVYIIYCKKKLCPRLNFTQEIFFHLNPTLLSFRSPYSCASDISKVCYFSWIDVCGSHFGSYYERKHLKTSEHREVGFAIFFEDSVTISTISIKERDEKSFFLLPTIPPDYTGQCPLLLRISPRLRDFPFISSHSILAASYFWLLYAPLPHCDWSSPLAVQPPLYSILTDNNSYIRTIIKTKSFLFFLRKFQIIN